VWTGSEACSRIQRIRITTDGVSVLPFFSYNGIVAVVGLVCLTPGCVALRVGLKNLAKDKYFFEYLSLLSFLNPHAAQRTQVYISNNIYIYRILVAFFREKRHRNYLERRNGSYSKNSQVINLAQPSLRQRRLGLISHEILAQKDCLLVCDFHAQTGIRDVRVRTLTSLFNLHRFPVLVGTEDHQSVRFAWVSTHEGEQDGDFAQGSFPRWNEVTTVGYSMLL